MKLNVVGPKAEIDKLREKLEPRLVHGGKEGTLVYLLH